MKTDLPILAFSDLAELHTWMEHNHASSKGIFVRVYKKSSSVDSVSFEDVLEEGLCFGWSESVRLKGDEQSYLQKFTPRRTKGTASERNRRYVARLIAEGRMQLAGLEVLGLKTKQ